MGRKGVTPVTRRAFFISPIGAPGSPDRVRSDVVLEHILKPALVPEHVDVIERADRMSEPGEITPAIVNAIMDADLVIADLSDANPNVYYELAIAHAFAKVIVHIIEGDENPRFDVKDVRAFPYGTRADQATAACKALSAAADAALAKGSQPTVVSRAAELRAVNDSGDVVAQQLAQLTGEVARLTRAVPPVAYPELGGPASEQASADSLPVPMNTAKARDAFDRLRKLSRADLAQWMHAYCKHFEGLAGINPFWATQLSNARPNLSELREYASAIRVGPEPLDAIATFARHFALWDGRVPSSGIPELPK